MALTSPARASVVAVLAAAAAGSACVDIVATNAPRYVEREEKRFAVTGRPDVTVSTFDGSIAVRAWDRSEVLVEIEKRAASQEAAAGIEVRAEQNGDRITLEVRVANGTHDFGLLGRSASLLVSVPASTDLQATSGDGSIDVERISGAIALRSGDGSIRGHGLSGDLRAQTGDGSVRLEDVDGNVDIGTGDGSIVASGRLAIVRARSGDGSVVVRAERGSVARDDWTIATGDGSVTLEVPDAFDADLEAHTGDGRVAIADGTLSETIQSTKRSIRGRLGAGGRSIRLRSGDGSITLRRS